MATTSAKFKITDPQIEVNNKPWAIKPNTLSYNEGLGTDNVEIASLGNGNYEVVISSNAEEKKGMCKFESFPTADQIDRARGLKLNPGANTIAISARGLNGQIFTRSFSFMTVVNDPEIALQTDGSFELQFEGGQAV